MKLAMTFHIRLMKENDIYAAVCLERDIVAQGYTREDAVEAWRKTMMGQIALDKKYHPDEPLLSNTPVTPLWYWKGLRFRDLRRVTIDETKIRLVE